jgi:hypothetical protein
MTSKKNGAFKSAVFVCVLAHCRMLIIFLFTVYRRQMTADRHLLG